MTLKTQSIDSAGRFVRAMFDGGRVVTCKTTDRTGRLHHSERVILRLADLAHMRQEGAVNFEFNTK